MAALVLRRAAPDDIGFMMAAERLPGYEAFVGRSDEATHRRHIADESRACFIAEDEAQVPLAFALFQDLDDSNGNVQLKRFVVAEPSRGLGAAFLPLALDTVFSATAAHRIWLRLVDGNARAHGLYRKCGLQDEGVQREAVLTDSGARINMLVMSILRPEWAAARG